MTVALWAFGSQTGWDPITHNETAVALNAALHVKYFSPIEPMGYILHYALIMQKRNCSYKQLYYQLYYNR